MNVVGMNGIALQNLTFSIRGKSQKEIGSPASAKRSKEYEREIFLPKSIKSSLRAFAKLSSGTTREDEQAVSQA